MKKIRKTYSGVVPNGKVLNSRNNSQQDTYSSDYLNRIIPNTNDLGKIVVDDISCKNLLDFNSITKYNRDLSSSPTVGSALSFYTETKALQFYIPATNLRGETLTYSNSSKYSNYIRIFELDSDYKYIKAVSRVGFTVGATTSYLCVILKEATDISTTATDIEPQLEKGSTATEYTPFKKFGYNAQESMGEIVVDGIVCKNIYDSYSYPLVINNAINGDDGTIYSSSANWYATVEYIPVNKYAGKNIISSSDSTTICFYDSNKVFISSIKKQGVVPTNSYYMRFDTHKDYANELYIELGTELTGYVEYQKFGKESVTNWTILNNDYGLRYRKVGNDVELSLIKSDTEFTITKNGALIELGTLPVECRPSTNIFIPVTNGGNLYGSLRLLIYSSGVISLQNLATSDVTFTYANAFTKYSALASAIA